MLRQFSIIALLLTLPLLYSKGFMPSQFKCTIDSAAIRNKNSESMLRVSPFSACTWLRGGSIQATNNSQIKPNTKYSLRESVTRNVLGLWGVLQVVSILVNAIKRLYPIAIQPILKKDILPIEWVMYGAWSLYMMYTEGYKAFQLKFSPLVVERSFGLSKNISILNILFAGPYSMGLFGAPRKRMILSWSLTAGVFALVKLVKLLPYPYRSIVDAGVVAGLSYGTLSICVLAIKAMLAGDSKVDKDDHPSP